MRGGTVIRLAVFGQPLVAFQGSGRHIALLDVPESTNLVGQIGKPYRGTHPVVVECVTELVDQRHVLFDKVALAAPLSGFTEHVERATTQEFELREHAEHRERPLAEALLFR